MTTLKERMADYRAHGDIPSPSEEHDNVGTLTGLFGAVIVMTVGFAGVLPLGAVVIALVELGLIPVAVGIVLGLVLMVAAHEIALYVGGPVADHVLGIPREEVTE